MLAPSGEVVHHDAIAGLDEDDLTAMPDSSGKPFVCVVLRFREVEILARATAEQASVRATIPCERAPRRGLPQPVYLDGAVGGGCAKVRSPVGIGRVTKRPRVHHIRPAAKNALDREKIGVTVAAAVWAAERAGVQDDLVGVLLPARAQDDVASVTENA